jgi:hypothetical protein
MTRRAASEDEPGRGVRSRPKLGPPRPKPEGDPRRPLKLLAACWGEPYLRRLARYGLASLASPGNLPALAESCAVEVVFLTSEEGAATLEAEPILDEIRRWAEIRFEPIDDLIASDTYSVTLTLAFTRGMALYGEAMTDIHFLYWNADFVMADGGLRGLLPYLDADRKVIFAPSLRAVAEGAEPLLESWRDRETRALAAPPRPLVALTLAHLHPTAVAQTVNQDLCWSAVPNKLFWKVGEDALLGRFFQIFMLCIKPTRARGSIDGYCDYCFAPAYCPGEPIAVVGDSDEMFILELQPRDTELDFVRLGPRDFGAWVRNIEEWRTPEHQLTAACPVLFHAGDRPAETDRVITESAKLIEEIDAAARPAASYAGQHYWVDGVASWLPRRINGAAVAPPPTELDLRLRVRDLKHPTYAARDGRALTRERLAAIRGRLAPVYRLLLGEGLEVSALNPDYAGLAAVAQEVAALKERLAAGEDRRAIVCARIGDWLDLELPPDHPRLFRIEPHQAERWRLAPEPAADEAIVYLRPGGEEVDVAALVQGLAGGLAPGARLTLLFHDAATGRADWPGLAARRSLSLAAGCLRDLELRLVRRSHADAAYAGSLARAADRLHAGDPRFVLSGAEAAIRGVMRAFRPASGDGAAMTAAAIITARVAAETQR